MQGLVANKQRDMYVRIRCTSHDSARMDWSSPSGVMNMLRIDDDPAKHHVNQIAT